MYIFCYYPNRRGGDPRLHLSTCPVAIKRKTDSRYTRWSPFYATQQEAVDAMTNLGLSVIPCGHCTPLWSGSAPVPNPPHKR